MVGGEFSSHTGVLAPAGMGLEFLPTKDLGQKTKGRVNDLAMGSQPQTILARPVSAVWVVVRRDAQDRAALVVAPVLLPAPGVEATVS
jgi:hypothetical protein